MSQTKESHGHMGEDRGFLNELQIQNQYVGQKGCFAKAKGKSRIERWFKEDEGNQDPKVIPHHESIDGITGGEFSCNRIVDKWMEWALTLPGKVNPIMMSGEGYGTSTDTENVHLFKEGKASVYFAAVSPFKQPDISRFVITERYPVLVPVYYAIASDLELPESKSDLNEVVRRDLCGIKEVEATLDDEDIYGCCVTRTTPLTIRNVPRDNIVRIPFDRLSAKDNVINIVHSGLWLLLDTRDKKKFANGDHLLYFRAKSVNYEIEAKIQISALF